MKILFFTRRFMPEIGGVETHVREVGKRLVAMGHEVTVVTEMPGGSSGREGAKLSGEVDGMKVHRIPVGKNERQKKFTIWKWLSNHRQLIEDADIVHCHDVFFWYLPFRLRYPRKKVFTTFHGYETKFPPEKKAIRVRKFSERLSRGNICVGDFIKKWYGTVPTYTTYGGVSSEPSVKSPLKGLSTSRGRREHREKERLNIVFIGRLEEDTGLVHYLDLLSLLRKNKIAYAFTALGEGPLKDMAAESGKVEGAVEDVEPYIQNADIVFASSYLSMLQALADKKLVIALYDNPLKEDYLKMSPFGKHIIAASSAHEALRQLKYFILNPNRQNAFISRGYEWAITQTWDSVTKQYLSLWKR